MWAMAKLLIKSVYCGMLLHTLLIIALVCQSVCKPVTSDDRKNVAILFKWDTYRAEHASLTTQLVQNIQLRQYRLSVATTNGLYIDFRDFPGPECMANRLKEHYTTTEPVKPTSILSIIDTVSIGLASAPGNTVPRFLLVVTDQLLQDVEDQKLSFLNDLFPVDIWLIILQDGHVTVAKYSFLREIMVWIEQGDNLNTLPFYDETLTQCLQTGYQVEDYCGRQCDCLNGRMTNCRRIRKAFSEMSIEERERYLDTYYVVTTDETYRPSYMQYADIHVRLFSRGIHDIPQFFPFHRRYLLGFENTLRSVDCRVTIPYWNWAKHSSHAWKILDNYPMWNDINGFGGNGSAYEQFCVQSGKFAEGKWPGYPREASGMIIGRSLNFLNKYVNNLPPVVNLDDPQALNNDASQFKQCLRRAFSCTPPTLRHIGSFIMCPEQSQFHLMNRMVMIWHDRIHNCTGGEMATEWSSATPEFWLHHAYLDSLWQTWQMRSEQHKYSKIFTEKPEHLIMGFKRELLTSYIDNNNLGDCGTAVAYTDPLEGWNQHHTQKEPWLYEYEVSNRNTDYGYINETEYQTLLKLKKDCSLLNNKCADERWW